MISRSLVACMFLSGFVLAGNASAQVLLCPQSPPSEIASSDAAAEAEKLLKRLTIALDLHGHRGISEGEILQAHAAKPHALLAVLAEVVNRCMKVSGDIETFHAALPELRRMFLEVTESQPDAESDAARDARIRTANLDSSEAERVEQSIDLSIRQIWRKLWFRPDRTAAAAADRWAVIVASPGDADSGWDELGEHQRRWKDAYFQLHEPFYDNNPHHAIVVGRRLPQAQAARLRDYVIELGMADDAYIWPLPLDEEGEDLSTADSRNGPGDGGLDDSPAEALDLSGLN